MKNILLLVISLSGLSVFSSNASADMIDVVHLKNGSVIKGVIIETIPNESLKIQTDDGSIFVYQMSEVEKMTKVRKKNKTPTNLVGSKSRPTATMLACAPGAFNLSGFGQLYNGEYIKALGFFVTQFTAAYLYVQSDSPGYGAIMLGTYGFSIYDANVSAKKINEKRLQQHEQSNASTLLQYVPNEGLMVSLSSGF